MYGYSSYIKFHSHEKHPVTVGSVLVSNAGLAKKGKVFSHLKPRIYFECKTGKKITANAKMYVVNTCERSPEVSATGT